jgi:hypothetical protein
MKTFAIDDASKRTAQWSPVLVFIVCAAAASETNRVAAAANRDDLGLPRLEVTLKP